MTTIWPDASDVDESELKLDEEIGSGGQGWVIRVLGRPTGVVFKRYKAAGADPMALKMLVDLPWSLRSTERERLFRLSAWPLARVMRHGQLSGFLMQEIPARFYAPNSRGSMKLRELQYLLYERKPAWGNVVPGEVSVETRLDVAIEFAKLVHLLHSESLVIGDVSMRNLLWAPGGEPSIFLIDCDGISRLGSPPVFRQVATPDWDDPMQSASRPDIDTDRYKLGLLVGRVLSGSPYVRPDAELPLTSDLPVSVALQVRKLWAWTAGPRGSRPTAVDWIMALNGGVRISPVDPIANRESVRSALDNFRNDSD